MKNPNYIMKNLYRLQNNSFTKPLKNSNGIALILAISMLAILSILGVMALNTADTETAISGNYRTSHMAFVTAERALAYASTNSQILDGLSGGIYNLNDDDYSDTANIEAGTGWGLDDTVNNTVEFQMAGGLPPGSGSDPTYFEARYYVINVSGADMTGTNNSKARIESQIGRIVPK